jgi:ribosome-associated protein
MLNPFIEKEVSKIIEENKAEYPKNIALACAWVIANFKGINIKIFDVRGSSSLCDYNIIASAQNTTQARSIIDVLSPALKANNQEIKSLEGVHEADWILMDAGDVIVHLFVETSRDIFDLDNLWSKYDQVLIPKEYYFGAAQTEASSTESTNNYF